MGIRHLFIFAVVASVGSVSAIALDKRPTSGQQLTGGECMGLGGTVGTSSLCSSGKVCKTVDQNGVLHFVCVSARLARKPRTDDLKANTPTLQKQ